MLYPSPQKYLPWDSTLISQIYAFQLPGNNLEGKWLYDNAILQVLRMRQRDRIDAMVGSMAGVGRNV
jgi:hypothetical protein